jgi:serine/threonine protein phosphatase 1
VITTSPPLVLDRTRVYVVGDIHGRSDLLDQMVEHISRDLEANPTSDCVTITLGDYIDRGPDSRGVLDRLVHNPFPMELVALKGNHEVLFEMFLNDPAVAEDWRRLGGLETLYSYGVPVSELMMGANYQQAAAALEAAVPNEHLKFWPRSRYRPSAAGISSATRACGPASRWSDKASKICCGFVVGDYGGRCTFRRKQPQADGPWTS